MAYPALLLIDLQKGFANEAHWGGNRNNPNAETVCFKLLSHWRARGWPIFHIRHHSTEPNSPLNPRHAGFAFMELTAPLESECVIDKQVNSAFIGTDLQMKLDQAGIDTLVIVGLTTNHCVSTTTRMAGNFGYRTFVVHDATATFDRVGFDGQRYDSEVIHHTALANLHGEFAMVVGSEQIVAMFDQ